MSAEQGGVAAAEFAELPRTAPGGAGQLNLDLIMDVRLMLTLEVGPHAHQRAQPAGVDAGLGRRARQARRRAARRARQRHARGARRSRRRQRQVRYPFARRREPRKARGVAERMSRTRCAARIAERARRRNGARSADRRHGRSVGRDPEPSARGRLHFRGRLGRAAHAARLRARGNGPLKVLAALPLGPRERLVLVEARGEELLIAVSPAGVFNVGAAHARAQSQRAARRTHFRITGSIMIIRILSAGVCSCSCCRTPRSASRCRP